MPVYIGIDLGKNCGYAVLETRGPGKPLVLKNGVLKTSGNYDWFVKVNAILDEVKKQCKSQKVYVAYEEVTFSKGMASARAYGGYRAMLEVLVKQHGFEWPLIPLSTFEVKKRFGGASFATKEEVMEGVFVYLCLPRPSKKPDLNSTDALAIAAAAIEEKRK